MRNSYPRYKWIQRPGFKSLIRQFVFTHSVNTLGKGMNPTILPPTLDK